MHCTRYVGSCGRGLWRWHTGDSLDTALPRRCRPRVKIKSHARFLRKGAPWVAEGKRTAGAGVPMSSGAGSTIAAALRVLPAPQVWKLGGGAFRRF